MLQHPGSSRREVSKEAIISKRQYHGAQQRIILSSLKALKNELFTFALPSYLYKNEFCIAFARTF